MFCYQCEQTAKGHGCEGPVGVCGKSADVAALQDLLTFMVKGLCKAAELAKEKNVQIPDRMELGRFICRAIFTTVTNVNFDQEPIAKLILETAKRRDAIKELVKYSGSDDELTLVPGPSIEEMIKQAQTRGFASDPEPNPDIKSLKHCTIFGIRGMSAYADHAAILGKEDEAVYNFIEKAYASLSRTDMDLEAWINMVMEFGKTNYRTMELLDAANTGAYGNPVPTVVPLGAKKGPAILVSGHDLKDMALLLEQTKGKGITVYTHGEMLPTHGYPELKAYDHFYGHFGTAWQNQYKEFGEFPGAILMTTNCIQRPSAKYMPNIFTTGLVGYPGAVHIGDDKDFTPLIERALALKGFPDDTDKGSVMVGFGHNAVLGVAGKVVDAVKAGKIKHFFLVGGCDGAKPGRNYYTKFVEQTPKDTIVLTVACGKFRFFDQKLGDIEGIPRLLDVGQCNDAYSAIRIAVALAEAFKCSVNELPLSFILSWYEQKAVAVLLTLLSLGIQNIHLGPSLPAFITPNIMKFLVEKFNIKPIDTPEKDLAATLAS